MVVDTEVGRWTAREPLILAEALDAYRYCMNNPIAFIDHHGLKPEKVEWGKTEDGKTIYDGYIWMESYADQLRDKLKEMPSLKELYSFSVKADPQANALFYVEGQGILDREAMKNIAPAYAWADVVDPNLTMPIMYAAEFYTAGFLFNPYLWRSQIHTPGGQASLKYNRCGIYLWHQFNPWYSEISEAMMEYGW